MMVFRSNSSEILALPYTNFLAVNRGDLTCPHWVPDRSAYSSRYVSPEALDKSNERCWIEPLTQM